VSRRILEFPMPTLDRDGVDIHYEVHGRLATGEQ
jgi:hypothetical protein